MARLMEHSRKSKCRLKSDITVVLLCIIEYIPLFLRCHWLKDTILYIFKKEKNDFNYIMTSN